MSLVAVSYLFNGGARKLIDRIVTEKHPTEGFVTIHDVFSLETAIFSSELKPVNSARSYTKAKQFHENLINDSRRHRDAVVKDIQKRTKNENKD